MATRRITSNHHRSRNRMVDSESIMTKKDCPHSNIQEIEQQGISYRVCADCGDIHPKDKQDLTKELQERNKKTSSQMFFADRTCTALDVIDTITAQTVQATLERVKEIVEGEKRPRMIKMNGGREMRDSFAVMRNNILDDIIKKLGI